MSKTNKLREEITKEILNIFDAYADTFGIAKYPNSKKITRDKLVKAIQFEKKKWKQEALDIIKKDADADGFCNAEYLIEKICKKAITDL